MFTDQSVENWLNNIVKEMRKNVRFYIKKAVYDYGQNREQSRIDWIVENCGMICIAASQIWWTAEVEEVFRRIEIGEKDAMKTCLHHLNEKINDLVQKGLSKRWLIFASQFA